MFLSHLVTHKELQKTIFFMKAFYLLHFHQKNKKLQLQNNKIFMFVSLGFIKSTCSVRRCLLCSTSHDDKFYSLLIWIEKVMLFGIHCKDRIRVECPFERTFEEVIYNCNYMKNFFTRIRKISTTLIDWASM